ncbi:hypothetical protein KR093_001716, partial [Drosophila rubida]
QFVESEIICYTPTGEEGTCISAKQCPFVIDLLTKYKNNITRIIRDQIREMACDSENEVVTKFRDLLLSHFHYQMLYFLQKFPICCPKLPQRILMTSQNLDNIDPSGMELLNSVTECGDTRRINKNRIGSAIIFPPVANGDFTRAGEFPWMALLKYDTEGRPFLCGGSLISDRFVLTAAHCTTTAAKIIGVRVGEHNLGTENVRPLRPGRPTKYLPSFQEFRIEDIRTHPNFERHSNSYDIAVIKLNRSVTFARHITPICLPIENKSQDIALNQRFYISGWGRSSETKSSASSTLLKAVVTRQDLDVCRKYYTSATLNQNHICAVGDRKQETCRGDSGGPLFSKNSFKNTTRFVQYGVISFGGLSCGINQNQPGVFASVLDMLPWITQNLY